MKYYYLKFCSAENMNGVVNMHKKSMFNPFVEFWSFLANFGGLETSLEILKTHQIFQMFYSLHMSFREKFEMILSHL